MSGLVEFLLARIAEDDMATNALMPSARRARLRAECRVKRRIVELWSDDAQFPSDEAGYELAIDTVVKELASVYADHPDYDETWRP